MKIMITCLLGLLIAPLCAFGRPIGETKDEPRNQAGDLTLRLKSISFIEDNEFFNPIVQGYTLLGFFFQPELIYSPSSKISLRAGGHFLKYSGTEKFSQIRPVFSTTLNFSERTLITLGSLSGPEKHQLFDPIFHDERLYNEYVEDGMQLIHRDSHFFTDTWISWENFIFRGDSTREQFTSGESFRYTSSPIAGFMSIDIPVQLEAKHFGGQISDYPQKTESFFNFAGGAGLNFDINRKRGGEAGIEYLRFVNWMRNGDSISGITSGRASWIRGYYAYKALRVEAGYWNAHDFYSPNGNPIYSSVSDFNQGLVIHDRRIVTSTTSIRFFPVSFAEFYFAVDMFYDVDLGRFDQTYVLHINFDKLISLNSRRRNMNM